MAQMKENAVAMEQCITTAYTRPKTMTIKTWESSIGTQKVIDIAAGCALLLFK